VARLNEGRADQVQANMNSDQGADQPADRRAEQSGRLLLNRSTFTKLVVVAFVMFGFGYAMVPVYRQVCEVLGINVLTQKDGTVVRPANTQVDMTRTVTVELDGNAQGPWRFRPTQRSVTVHPGAMTQVTYEVVNTQGRSVKAQAIPSYASASRCSARTRRARCRWCSSSTPACRAK
jgi:cytochrome c oxidase assembly protein subunit 11